MALECKQCGYVIPKKPTHMASKDIREHVNKTGHKDFVTADEPKKDK